MDTDIIRVYLWSSVVPFADPPMADRIKKEVYGMKIETTPTPSFCTATEGSVARRGELLSGIRP
jgi:hypothetical protein